MATFIIHFQMMKLFPKYYPIESSGEATYQPKLTIQSPKHHV